MECLKEKITLSSMPLGKKKSEVLFRLFNLNNLELGCVFDRTFFLIDNFYPKNKNISLAQAISLNIDVRIRYSNVSFKYFQKTINPPAISNSH